MSHRSMSASLLAFLTLALAVSGEEKPVEPPAAKDALPTGALLRLGQVEGKDSDAGHTARVSAVAFSPDGKRIATGSWDYTVRLWDAATGKMLQRMAGHRECVFSVAFSPDGKTLASASRDRTVRLWDVATGKEVGQCSGHTEDVFGVAFAPDGKTLASGGFDHVARLWETATCKELLRFEGLNDEVSTVLFTPDGKVLLTACHNGRIAAWDVATGKELRRFAGHKGWVFPLSLSTDGKTLASGGLDGTIRLWEVATGKMRREFRGQGGDVLTVALSPDGQTLASASEGKNVVRLWDIASRKSRGQFEGHKGEILHLDFSRDGKRLVSASDDHTAIVWTVPSAAADPKDRAALTPAEVEVLWNTLSKTDAEAAYAAIIRLSQGSPADWLPFLDKQLQLPPSPKVLEVARRITDLDDDDFDVRERASAVLERAGGAAIPQLRRVLKGSPSAEMRRRAEAILSKLDADDWISPEERRQLRAIELLERSDTPETRKLLEELAKKTEAPEMAEQAKAALARCKGR